MRPSAATPSGAASPDAAPSAVAQGDAQRATAISVAAVSKCYPLYDRPENRLKQAIVPRLQRAIGMAPSSFFRESWALRDVSFEVARGETVGIIGRNGSGKSTLLQVICGTLTPTAGRVSVGGRIGALLELGSGFNPEFTGRENVHMNAAILGMGPEEIAAKYDAIVAFADIGEFIDQPVKTYSSGMYVRLAFAVIAHADADLLVVDEALSVGDVFFAQKCMRFLREFQKRGTVLFVSHSAAAIVNLCDRAIWLDRGRVALDGPAKAVCEAYHAHFYGHAVSAPAAPSEAPLPTDEDVGHPAVDASLAKVFRFDPTKAGFGDGRARIEQVRFEDLSGRVLTQVAGDEIVRLIVEFAAVGAMESPIVGFFFKDKLGQQLFGKHTWHERASAQAVEAGDAMRAVFEFRMPYLPRGRYTIDIAVADGTHFEHVQAAWVYDAVALESAASTIVSGLIGLPFRSVTLETRDGRD